MSSYKTDDHSEWLLLLSGGVILILLGFTGKMLIDWLFADGNLNLKLSTFLDFKPLSLLSLVVGIFLVFMGVKSRTQHRAVLDIHRVNLSTLRTDSPAWKPPPGVTNHRGESLDPDGDFFMPPPPEIGEVLTAHTSKTFRDMTRDRNTIAKIPVGLLAAAIAYGAFWFAFHLCFKDEPAVAQWAGAIGAGFSFVAMLISTGYVHSCTYVGAEGIARFVCRWSRGQIVEADLFLFEKATELRYSATKNYENGFYSNTDFRFDWFGGDKSISFRIAGGYGRDAENDRLPGPLKYQWGLSAEAAWSRHYFERMRQQIVNGGQARFDMLDGGWLIVEEGRLIIHLKNGKEVTCPADDIEHLLISKGVYELAMKGSWDGLFSSEGIYELSHDSIANAQVFLAVLEAVGKIRVLPAK